MKHHLFTIYDSKSEIYLPPFTTVNEGTARRMFEDTVNDSNSKICQHPEDYTLFHLGYYNDNTAMLEQLVHGKQSICTAIEIKELTI